MELVVIITCFQKGCGEAVIRQLVKNPAGGIRIAGIIQSMLFPDNQVGSFLFGMFVQRIKKNFVLQLLRSVLCNLEEFLKQQIRVLVI